MTDSMGARGEFGAPIACINEGNSNLCDGTVTFFAVKAVDRGFVEKKFSIMVQAKDYDEKTGLDATKLNEHAKTMANQVLDGVFGDLRLLCVASGSESLLAARAVDPRDFLPFKFKSGVLLNRLLAKLQSQRSQSIRVEKYACFCDENGREVYGYGDELFENRKRKR